ncbi:MAG: class I SAM-dependent methyltransferase [Dehalococcoidia bacterium]|jgi:SAM-dependent methyltransferase|nr:class I SAM-dependent methyltransferase [Dehalococcoidia bacterium]
MSPRHPLIDPLYTEFAWLYDERFGADGIGGPDVGFYTRLALEARGPVVELAVGTGRVALPIVRSGVPVLGLDLSPSMLAIARRKAVEEGIGPELGLAAADMRTFALAQPAALITIPARAFLHNLTMDDQMATLASCRAALEPGGRLALNVFNPNLEMIAHWMKLPADQRKQPGDLIPDTLESRDYDPAEQRVDTRIRMKARGGKSVVAIRLRWVYRFEMEHLLSRSGFEVEALYGNFDGQAFELTSTEMVWVARAV